MSDEREALARVIAETRYRWMRGQGDGRTGAETVADAVIAAGWRRSPQPADPAKAREIVTRWLARGDDYPAALVDAIRIALSAEREAGWRGIYDPPGELGLGAPTHWQPFRPPSEQPQPADPRVAEIRARLEAARAAWLKSRTSHDCQSSACDHHSHRAAERAARTFGLHADPDIAYLLSLIPGGDR